MGKRWTLAGVKRVTREALRAEGLEATVESAKWLSTGWCWPKVSGPLFKVARVWLVNAAGSRYPKLVTVENNGGWSIR